MDEHMMAAEIAALKNEIETLKRQNELLGYDIDTYKMTLKTHKEVIETLKGMVKAERVAQKKVDTGVLYCSDCWERALSYYNYCPHCGAKFEEVTDGH